MSYLALYRRYRPRDFDGIIGQVETIEILKNQIKQNKFVHAYLFSGIRGTGKTSTAKIMAKSINCLNPLDGNPCNECEICKAINNDSFMDVIEIDAASNNGVDNIRELRENTKYLPSKGSHKVYIIDEVQMLSSGAFNALLKTLEEPSKHVVFILATTEPEKIPATIISRCQRYDFKRVELDAMIKEMKRILEDLSCSYDEEALNLIALKSDGAMRDALSLLEKVVSKSNEHISENLTSKVLGIVEFVELSNLFEAILSQEIDSAIIVVDRMILSGVSIKNIFEQILEFLRNIMLINVFKVPTNIIALPERIQLEMINKFSEIDLQKNSEMIDIINQAISKLKYSANPRLNLELAAVTMSLLFQEKKTVKKDAIEQKVMKESVVVPKKEEVLVNIEKIEESIENDIEDDFISREINNDNIISDWNQILENVKLKRRITHAFLIEGNLVKVEKQVIYIEFQPEYDFHRGNVMLPDNKNIIEKVLLEHTNKRYTIEAVVVKEKKSEEKSDVEKIKDFLGDEYKEILKVK